MSKDKNILTNFKGSNMSILPFRVRVHPYQKAVKAQQPVKKTTLKNLMSLEHQLNCYTQSNSLYSNSKTIAVVES